MNDLAKTQLQTTGECFVSYLTVLEIAEIVADLGVDPRQARVKGAGSNTAVLYISENRLAGGQSVTLR